MNKPPLTNVPQHKMRFGPSSPGQIVPAPPATGMYALQSSAGTPIWATPSSGFSDNASAQRTRQESWLRRNEYTTSGEGGNNTITLSSVGGIPTPIIDIGSSVSGSGLAILGDRVFFVGRDSNGNQGALYGVDLYNQTGISNGGTFLHQYKNGSSVADAPTDLLGVRTMNSSATSQTDYLFGIFPNANFVNLGTIHGSPGAWSYTQTYNVSTGPASPVRACVYGGVVGFGTNSLIFFYSGSDGHIYAVHGTGGTITSVVTTGDTPGAMFVDDNDNLWVTYTTSGTIARFSIVVTGGTPALTLVSTYSTTGPWGASLTAMVDMISDGRYAWVLDSAAFSSGAIAGFDLQSGALVQSFHTPATVVGGNVNRLAWDGVSLYFTSGNSGNSVWRVQPESGEALFVASTGSDAVSRGIVVDDSGTVIIGNYFGGLNLTLAGGTFENRSFNSIRYLGRPLQFIYGGRQQGQATVINGTPVTLTQYTLTALCRTSTGTTSVTTPTGSFGGQQWVVTVTDVEGQAATNNISVSGSGAQMEDPNNLGTYHFTVTLNKNNQTVTWIWNGEATSWKVLSTNYTGTPVSAITRPILAGAASTPNGSSNPLRVGSLYFNPSDEYTGYKVFFRVVIETTNASDAVVIDLSDVNNVLGNGVGAEVPGSQLTSTSTTEVFMSVEIPDLEAGTLAGSPILLDCRLWINPTDAGQQATCTMAQLVIQ